MTAPEPDRPDPHQARTVAPLTVLTQNIRNNGTEVAFGHPDRWEDRRHALADLLRGADADVIGLQEVLLDQIPTIDEALAAVPAPDPAPTYQRLGYGRDGGGRGEHNLLVLRRDRFTVLDWDQFWLSPTPETIGSTGWGAGIPRICTWARVRDEAAAGRELVLAVTHLDHESDGARTEGARLIAERLRRAAGDADLPIVLIGDFNADASGSGAHRALEDAGLRDAHEITAAITGEDIGTFPDYGPVEVGGERIDWVMVRNLPVAEYRAEDHVITLRGGRPAHASDHAGVLVRIG